MFYTFYSVVEIQLLPDTCHFMILRFETGAVNEAYILPFKISNNF